MDIIIEPYVSLGINVAVDEVNLAFALACSIYLVQPNIGRRESIVI